MLILSRNTFATMIIGQHLYIRTIRGNAPYKCSIKTVKIQAIDEVRVGVSLYNTLEYFSRTTLMHLNGRFDPWYQAYLVMEEAETVRQREQALAELGLTVDEVPPGTSIETLKQMRPLLVGSKSQQLPLPQQALPWSSGVKSKTTTNR